MIHSKVQATNEHLDKISTDVDEQEIGNVKKEIGNLERNIKNVENDLLDPEEVSSKLIELEYRSCQINVCIDGIQETPNET